MCGIVGYVGTRPALNVVIEGLRRLEYRGYDSAGIALVVPTGSGGTRDGSRETSDSSRETSDGSRETRDGSRGTRDGSAAMFVVKRAGKLANLDKALADEPAPEATTGIGHTRWATHGPPNDRNAHPHLGAEGRVAVVHNGILENFANLRTELERSGHELRSDTDTEVAAHLIEREVVAGVGLADAVRKVCRRLDGAFTLVVTAAEEPGRVVAARRNSPLVVGLGRGENFLASDVAAFIEHTREALELGQDQVVTITAETVEVTDFVGNAVEPQQFHVDWDISAAEKSGYDYFMLKEIAEQPRAVADTLLGRFTREDRLQLDEMRLSDDELRNIDKIIIVACGTAFHAGLVAKYAIEHWTRIPCEVELASEFRYRDPIVDRDTMVIAISQSGETMDTLMALRHAREQRAKVLAISNTNGATIPRESDAVLYTHAGPEIAVASTKAFLTQIVACYLIALYLAQVRGTKFDDEIAEIIVQLERIPAAVAEVLDTVEPVRELARDLRKATSVFFLGRHVGYPVALEGALKLKELAYMHAEGFAAGELKHGPIALVEEGVPVFVVLPAAGRGVLHDKMVSNIAEIRARGARTIVLAEQDDVEVASYADVLIPLPSVPALMQPLVATVPMQVFACEMATVRGHDVDQPRNLAKSVTVE